MKRTLLPAAGLSYLAVFVLLGLGEVGGLHVNIPKKVLFEEILRQTRSWTRPGLFPGNMPISPDGLYAMEDEAEDEGSQCPAAELLAQDKRLSCRARKALVPLPPGPPEAVRFPKVVELERCQGSCYQDSSHCLPVETKQVIVPVILVNLTDRKPVADCSEVIMEKHTKCKCGCRIQRSQCSGNQVYSAMDCACRCLNLSDAKRCTGPNKTWDPIQCSCGCIQDQLTSCSTGYYFSTEDCRCVSS